MVMFSHLLCWEPFAVSCFCVSSILTMMNGRPGRRRSPTHVPRRHEELFNQDVPVDGPPAGIPPPITLFNTRVNHPARYFNRSSSPAAVLTVHPAPILSSHATAPADISASSESDHSPVHESRCTAVLADAKSSPTITSTVQTAAEFLSRPEPLRSSSAPALKRTDSRRHKRRDLSSPLQRSHQVLRAKSKSVQPQVIHVESDEATKEPINEPKMKKTKI